MFPTFRIIDIRTDRTHLPLEELLKLMLGLNRQVPGALEEARQLELEYFY